MKFHMTETIHHGTFYLEHGFTGDADIASSNLVTCSPYNNVPKLRRDLLAAAERVMRDNAPVNFEYGWGVYTVTESENM